MRSKEEKREGSRFQKSYQYQTAKARAKKKKVAATESGAKRILKSNVWASPEYGVLPRLSGGGWKWKWRLAQGRAGSWGPSRASLRQWLATTLFPACEWVPFRLDLRTQWNSNFTVDLIFPFLRWHTLQYNTLAELSVEHLFT